MSKTTNDGHKERAFLEKVFGRLFDLRSSEEGLSEFFTRDYTQDVNGKIFRYQEFVDNLAALKKTLKYVKVDFGIVISTGNTIAETHTVDALRKNGKHLRFKVIAFQRLEHGRIKSAEEVTCPL